MNTTTHRRLGLIAAALFVLAACAPATTPLAPTATVLATAAPAVSPTSPAPTAGVSWAEPAVEITGLPADFAPRQVVWQSNDSLSLQSSDGTSYTIDVRQAQVTLVATAAPRATIVPHSPPSINATADYQIACDAGGLKLSHLPDLALIGQAALKVQDCAAIAWANDETAASIVADDGAIYVWRVDGSAPAQVGQTGIRGALAPWSPDSTRFVAPVLNAKSGFGSLLLGTVDGRPMQPLSATLEIGNGWDPGYLNWLTNRVIVNSRQCGDGGACLSHAYYDAATGQYLIGYRADSRTGEGQPALLSPDGGWLAVDTFLAADQWDQRDSRENPVLVLYDFAAKRKQVWAKSDGSIAFDFWTADSQRLLASHYPNEASSADPGPLPYGLLAANPQTFQTDALVKNVVSATWNPARALVYLVTAAAVEPKQARQLQGAIYSPDGRPVTAPQTLTDTLGFDTPAHSVPVAWSHNGQQVAFGDGSGNVWLHGTDGTTRQLGSTLPTNDWAQGSVYSWSPDDTQLFVLRPQRAWVVTVGASH